LVVRRPLLNAIASPSSIEARCSHAARACHIPFIYWARGLGREQNPPLTFNGAFKLVGMSNVQGQQISSQVQLDQTTGVWKNPKHSYAQDGIMTEAAEVVCNFSASTGFTLTEARTLLAFRYCL
jgi:hypothetical protein